MAVVKIQGENEKRQGVYYLVDTSLPPLGVGGMGQVFRGTRVEEKTGVTIDVAVKFLFDDLTDNAIERSRREASIQIDNENLVKMYGFIETEDNTQSGTRRHYHVVSELLHGVMLLDVLNGKTTDNNGEEVPFARQMYEKYKTDRYGFAMYIVKNMLSGILALHSKGYIHRDIDPSNVMLTAEGKVKIIDYGIAKKLNTLSNETHLTVGGVFMGKAAYAAPELVLGDVSNQNETTDLYAIGIVLYELIAGELPFNGSANDILEMQLKKPVPVKNIESRPMRKIIAKATAKKQADRYLSAAEFIVAIERLIRTTPTSSDVKVDLKTNQWHNLLKNKKVAIPVGAAALVILICCIVFANGNEENKQQPTNEITTAQMAQLRAEKQKEIIDDNTPYIAVDSVTGVNVPSAGYLTEQALKQLTDGKDVNLAINTLDRVIDNGKKSSARAAYIKGILHLDKGNIPDGLQKARLAAASSIQPDDAIAHQCYMQAVELDSTFYPALFELGIDFHNGEIRGLDAVDETKARNYFEKAYKYASMAQDKVYMERCKTAFGFFE